MPDDATEGVVEHSSRLQPSINLHAPVTAFMLQVIWYTMYYPEGMKARVMTCAVIEALIVYKPPLRTRTRAAGFKIISGDHYTTTAHSDDLYMYLGWLELPSWHFRIRMSSHIIWLSTIIWSVNI